MSTRYGPFEDLDDLKAHLEGECDAGRIFQVYGPAGDHIVWAADAQTAFGVYVSYTNAPSRGFSKLSWRWLNENMLPFELTKLTRDGIVKSRRT